MERIEINGAMVTVPREIELAGRKAVAEWVESLGPARRSRRRRTPAAAESASAAATESTAAEPTEPAATQEG